MICFGAADKKAQNLIADVCTGRVPLRVILSLTRNRCQYKWRHCDRKTRGHDEFAVHILPEGGYSKGQLITNISVQKLKLDLPKLFS